MAKNLATVVKSLKNEVSISRDTGMVIIGERINPTGRNALQAELKAGIFNMVRKDAVAQLQAGASILDINSGLPRADEPALLVQMIKEVRDAADDPPICIDTPNVKALEAALSYYCKDGAKPLVNSVTAETESLKRVLPLIKEYGAAVIGLCSGDDGIPKTAGDRLKYTDIILEEAAKLNIPAENIVIDCLVLTLGAKWEAGRIALDAITMIVEKYGVNITMGASNISFGLPERKFLNQTFMVMAIAKGLDGAIVNPLDQKMMANIITAEALAGKDEFCMKYLEAFRAKKFEF